MFTTPELEAIRKDFPILFRTLADDRHLIYLDNAASTQKPKPVLQTFQKFSESSYANIHRGVYRLSLEATEAYDQARKTIANFIKAKSEVEIVFTRNATEAINLVAYGFARKYFHPGDEIVLTELEHHANLVPWQQVCQATGAKIVAIPFEPDGSIDVEKVIAAFSARTKMLAITGCSNVFGTIIPLKSIISAAKQQRIVVLVDGAQLVPHYPINVQELECDFLVASGHKMLAPSGIGFLYGRREWLALMDPMLYGGDMINEVWIDRATWAEIPNKFEAGTPNIEGAVALGKAAEYLQHIGLMRIHQHSEALANYAASALQQLPNTRVLGSSNRSGIVTFLCTDVHPHDLASFLDAEGIAIRAGHHCTQPLHRKLGVPATARASFYLYNTQDEAERLIEAVEKAIHFFSGKKVFFGQPPVLKET
ncbi:MAG: SufS family cysteine desulfurase [bacterium]|nr:SufS family cysteine desulfurase [bacterium]